MKSLTILILCALSVAAQTTPPQATTKSLAELARGITPDGPLPLTTKKISDLKVSDLPNAPKDPLSLDTTFRCQALEELTLANEQQNGAIAAQVPQDVLEGAPDAASGCLALHLMALKEDSAERAYADVGAMIDATDEIRRRQISRLADQYNALLAVARNLQTQLLAVQRQDAQNHRVRNALELYQLMPKYTPPQTINIQVTDCTKLPALCVH
jgi:hypothetical protein